MNIKVMVLIVIILLVVAISLQVFLPKNIDLATGKISTFKKDDQVSPSNTPAAEVATV